MSIFKLSIINKLRSGFIQNMHDKVFYEEIFQSLIQELYFDHNNIQKRISNIRNIKKSIKDELLKRIYKAKSYIDTNLSEQISINELGKVAMLSPFHFFRIFKSYFQCSQHQYNIEKRIQEAKFLLEDTNENIKEIVEKLAFKTIVHLGELSKLKLATSQENID